MIIYKQSCDCLAPWKGLKKEKLWIFMDREKPNRFATPTLVRILTGVGLTNLTGEQVRDYETSYNSHYGTPKARSLRLLHRIGLTNLTDEQVERYCDQRNP